MAVYHLTVPLKEDDIRKLRIGDTVFFDGEIFSTRSKFQKYIFDQGMPMPLSTKDRNLLIHCGPVIVQENGKWTVKSYAPTTSIRFEKWGERSIREWGLRCIIGKASMGPNTMQAMKELGCVHVCMLGVTSNLGPEHVEEVEDVFYKDELGSIEACWLVRVKDYGPFLVDIDTTGKNYFDQMDGEVDKRKELAFAQLGIPTDFQYTKLY